jgi:hypothetical protein
MIMKPVQNKDGSCHRVLTLLAGLFCTMSMLAQNFNVKGLVTDKNGEPVIGATVLEAETKNGVATDLDGAFTIKVSSGKAVLRVSYIGYKTQEVAVNGRSETSLPTSMPSSATTTGSATTAYGRCLPPT